MTAEYPRDRRITQRLELQKVSRTGKRVRASDFDVRYLSSPRSFIRAGIIIPLHGHTAVERNRLKRRVRELLRIELFPLAIGADMVFRGRASAYSLSYDDLRGQLLAIAKQMAIVSRTEKGE